MNRTGEFLERGLQSQEPSMFTLIGSFPWLMTCLGVLYSVVTQPFYSHDPPPQCNLLVFPILLASDIRIHNVGRASCDSTI
jgi:hypothetical protein